MKESTRRKYEEDIFRTTNEIAYHIVIRDTAKDEETKRIQQSTIDKRVKHLAKIKEKYNRIYIDEREQ